MSSKPYQAHLEHLYVIMNKKDVYKHLLHTTELTKKRGGGGQEKNPENKLQPEKGIKELTWHNILP